MHRRHVLRSSLALALALAVAACASAPPAAVDPGVPGRAPGTTTPGPAAEAGVHVAFAGGGWRAHTGHSAYTLVLLASEGHALADAFRHVRTVSSNSGGSWFSTMLQYSAPFVADVESPSAFADWDTPDGGWLGRQRALFDATPCGHLPGGAYTACALLGLLGSGATDWADVVEDVVFEGYRLDGTALRDDRRPWADDTALLLAATMLTGEAVLDGSGGRALSAAPTLAYQACRGPAAPALDGPDGWRCAAPSTGRPVAVPPADVAAVTFSRLPDGGGRTVPPFLRGAARTPLDLAPPAALVGRGAYLLGYADAGGDRADHVVAVRGPIATEQVPVMLAAAASSAAGGFVDSERLTRLQVVSDLFENESLGASLADGAVTFADPEGRGLPALADGRFVRLADGGAVDNSAVAQLVSALQLDGLDDGFHVVAFDHDVATVPTSGDRAAGSAIAALFGVHGPGIERRDDGPAPYLAECGGAGPLEVCLDLPLMQVFARDAFHDTAPTWRRMRAPSDSAHGLIYTAYPVRTVDNGPLGVEAGSRGTLHAFTTVWAEATTAPEGAASFDAYAEMLRFIGQALTADGDEGLGHLRRALGLE